MENDKLLEALVTNVYVYMKCKEEDEVRYFEQRQSLKAEILRRMEKDEKQMSLWG